MNASETLKIIGAVVGESVGPRLVSRIIDLNAKVLELQSVNFSLQKRIFELENENKEALRWEKLERDYKLLQLAGRFYVRSGKSHDNPAEPIHMLCADCFNLRKKVHLQALGFDPHKGTTYRCNGCGFEVTI